MSDAASTPTSSAPTSSPLCPYILDATSESFAVDVIERSRTAPVVVDFWAPWCGPCKMLGPVLEKLAREYDGKFTLVKVDVDQASDVAGSFGVRSIPAVFGVRDGQVFDAFTGVLPENSIRQWIDRLLPSPAETLITQAQALEATDPQTAEAKYAEALAIIPDLPEALLGLARLALAAGRTEEAAGVIFALERRGFLEPEGEKLKAELILRTQAANSGGVDAARAALADEPKHQARKFALAEALAA
ncbi:MAG: thioredoxin, partial [Paludisphaera borealis]|uniref:thioredoxin n=1 Tax=Paludisphaera borealis TaxID=1387353 RepID=UPI0028411B74